MSFVPNSNVSQDLQNRILEHHFSYFDHKFYGSQTTTILNTIGEKNLQEILNWEIYQTNSYSVIQYKSEKEGVLIENRTPNKHGMIDLFLVYYRYTLEDYLYLREDSEVLHSTPYPNKVRRWICNYETDVLYTDIRGNPMVLRPPKAILDWIGFLVTYTL
jgi:hypothetical protein